MAARLAICEDWASREVFVAALASDGRIPGQRV
jgi:hypothetical protein